MLTAIVSLFGDSITTPAIDKHGFGSLKRLDMANSLMPKAQADKPGTDHRASAGA